MTRRLGTNILTLFIATAIVPAAATSSSAESSDAYVQMVVGLLGNADADFRAAALDQIRTGAKGAPLTQTYAAQLSKLDASGQIALLSALADRGDAAARPAVLELLTAGGDENVRAAALRTLGKLGDATDLPLLVKALSSTSAVESTAARQSLVFVRGEGASQALAVELKSAQSKTKAALIEVLAARRAVEELPVFVAATLDDDAQVRSAAMNAIGQIGRPEQISAMLPGVLKAAKGGERDGAEKNVALVCSRIVDENARADALIAALEAIAPAERDQLLSLIGRVGGKKLINFVGDIATSSDPARRTLGIDALSKWPDAGAADKLLDIAEKTNDANERKLAYGGFVKISATRDKRNDRQRLDRMKQAMKAARSPEEQALVINRTRTAYDVEAMRFVLPFVDDPQFAQLACETIVELAHHREVRDPNKAEFDKVLDKVKAVSKDPIVVDRAGRYQRGETWTRPTK